MGATKKATHVIAQKNVYFHCVKGKPQRSEVGDPIALTDDQAAKMGKKVKPVSDKATLDLTGADKTSKKGADTDSDKDSG